MRPLLHRLAEVRKAAAGYTAEPLATQIGDGIREFARHPVVAELTS